MRLSTTVLVTALCITVVNSIPVPENNGLESQALDRLVMVEAEKDTALRNKRTIGILRQLFPEISQIIEQKVNMITTEIFRILGPVFLRGALGGGGNGAANAKGGGSGTTVTLDPFDDFDDFDSKTDDENSNGSRVSIELPTFPPDENDSQDSNSVTIKTESTSEKLPDDNVINDTEKSV